MDAVEFVEPLEGDEMTSQTDPAPEADVVPDGVTTGPAQSQAVEGVAEFPEQPYEAEEPLQFESSSDASSDSATSGSDQSGVDEEMVDEEMLVFPEQSYEIEESLEIESDYDAGVAEYPEQPYGEEESLETDSQADEEIDRLREQLAASEEGVARSREREAERDYDADQAGSSAGQDGSAAADSDAMGSASDGDDTSDYTSDATNADPEPEVGDRTSFPVGKPAEFSIYFGYNQVRLELEFEAMVVKHVEYLRANPDLKIEIQGNCDERGSREYNIALGGRRAHTVKRAFELLGIGGNRIRTVSFGAEKPVAFGHDDESWRLNRRADIMYY